MTLWAIFRSPLIFGGHMPDNDEFTLSLLTNKDILDINQFSSENRPVISEKDRAVWTCVDKDGNTVVAFFNMTDDDMEFSMPDGLVEAETYKTVDLWTKEEKTVKAADFSVTVDGNSAVILRIC